MTDDQIDEIALRLLERLASTDVAAKSGPKDVAFTAYEFAEAFAAERKRRRDAGKAKP